MYWISLLLSASLNPPPSLAQAPYFVWNILCRVMFNNHQPPTIDSITTTLLPNTPRHNAEAATRFVRRQPPTAYPINQLIPGRCKVPSRIVDPLKCTKASWHKSAGNIINTSITGGWVINVTREGVKSCYTSGIQSHHQYSLGAPFFLANGNRFKDVIKWVWWGRGVRIICQNICLNICNSGVKPKHIIFSKDTIKNTIILYLFIDIHSTSTLKNYKGYKLWINCQGPCF